jgi:hypothetical protein
MVAPAIPGATADLAEIASIDDDLRRRLSMVAGADDLVVLLGMIAAGKADPAILGEPAAGGRPGTSHEVWDELAAGPHPLDLTGYGLPAGEVARFQRLWYHFKVPFAQASLAWWYLFCLALRREDDAGRALAQLDRWLAALGPRPSAGRAAGLLGLPGEPAVTVAETGDTGALLAAVRRGAPLLWAGEAAAGGGGWWLGAPPDLRDCEDRVRARWAGLGEDERGELLAGLAQKVTSIERVRFLLDESVTENRATAKMLAQCREQAPARWPYPHLVLATVLWCWQTAGFTLQELNQSFISLAALSHFLLRRTRLYAAVCGEAAASPADPDPVTLAEGLAAWRGRVERSHMRCLHFDGSNWERREFLLPRAAMERPHEIPGSLRHLLHEWTGAEFPGSVGTLAAWDRFLELALAAGCSPTRVMQAVTQWAADAPDLPIDMAVFTAPRGSKMTEPWTMNYGDIFCYTAFRHGFAPAEHGIPGDLVSIQNIQGQRQRFNAVKKAQNYAPVRRMPPQGFNLPDISIAEDANHAGHFAAGVRLACRVPITVVYRGTQWNGLSDIRLNRVEYRRDNRFMPADLTVASRYAQWVKGVADATYRRDLTFDAKWGSKVNDLEL